MISFSFLIGHKALQVSKGVRQFFASFYRNQGWKMIPDKIYNIRYIIRFIVKPFNGFLLFVIFVYAQKLMWFFKETCFKYHPSRKVHTENFWWLILSTFLDSIPVLKRERLNVWLKDKSRWNIIFALNSTPSHLIGWDEKDRPITRGLSC